MKTRNRPGVLLLIVLALLAMFGVLAIAFVILTGQTRRGADALRKVGQYDDQWEKTANQAALDVFRGSNNHQSPFQCHSLLENLYGNEWFMGTMSGASPVIGQGQLIQFAFAAGYPTNKTFAPEQHLGAVLTVLTGPLAGYSTHIVGMAGTPTQLQIAAFEGVSSTPAQVIGYINGCTCLINGMPYSGTGFGFQWPPARSANAPSMLSYNNATDANGWEFALLPNHAAFPYNTTDNGYSATYVNWLGQPDPAGPGGANPDYTAPDYQNMFLALRLTTPWTTPNGNVVYVPIPSFHRPELVNFWMNLNGGGTWSNPILQRKVLLRPLAAPINPGISAIDLRYGPWDVNNAGDGYPDSIWIDPGYEIRSTPDGRLYKPLVAVLCIDLDGRLNLNAHGSLAQLQADFLQVPNIGSTLFYGGGVAPPAGAAARADGLGPGRHQPRPVVRQRPQLSRAVQTTADGNQQRRRAAGRTLRRVEPLGRRHALQPAVARLFDQQRKRIRRRHPQRQQGVRLSVELRLRAGRKRLHRGGPHGPDRLPGLRHPGGPASDDGHRPGLPRAACFRRAQRRGGRRSGEQQPRRHIFGLLQLRFAVIGPLRGGSTILTSSTSRCVSPAACGRRLRWTMPFPPPSWSRFCGPTIATR